MWGIAGLEESGESKTKSDALWFIPYHAQISSPPFVRILTSVPE